MIRYGMKKGINAAPFVAVEVDETTDVTKLRSLSFCILLLKAWRLVKEAFLGFDDESNDKRAAAIFFRCPSCFHLFMFAYCT